MQATWAIKGTLRIAYVDGTKFRCVFYPLENGSWRWEIRFDKDFVRTGVAHNFNEARDTTFALFLENNK